MPGLESDVQAHYTTGVLEDRLRRGAAEMGADPQNLTAADLKMADEFHTGGVQATDHLFDQLTITPDMQVLDVGCGIGGTSRYIATRFDAHVTGFDLTQEFVETAGSLNAAVGLSDKIVTLQGSAVEMPVGDAGFDLAVMLHVGMNIADKPAVFREASRVLKPGGTFAVFDVMRGTDADTPLIFPLPWSSVEDTSFVETPAAYLSAADAAGFTLEKSNDRGAFAKAFMTEALAKAETDGPAPLGIHLMMGETARVKLDNYLENVSTGRIAPVELFFRKGA